ncbi:MAG: hypothetical protein K1X36_00415, partial [Pyrinomonadaceae bacterium]|nr:hypothetical protein [Pyrinomonadaceae bacterium]
DAFDRFAHAFQKERFVKVLGRRIEEPSGLFSRIVAASDEKRSNERPDRKLGGELIDGIGVMLANIPTLLHTCGRTSNYGFD